MEGGSFDPEIFTNAEVLFNWIFQQIQQIYNLMVSNWILNICLFIVIFGLVISLFKLLLMPILGSSGYLAKKTNKE